MGRKKGAPMFTTSVRISPEFWNLADEHRISFTEAVRVGIGLLLAEKGVKEYNSDLNITRKLDIMRQKLEETSQKLAEMEK